MTTDVPPWEQEYPPIPADVQLRLLHFVTRSRNRNREEQLRARLIGDAADGEPTR